MEIEQTEIEKLVRDWTRSSDEDFGAMIGTFEIKKYNWALYIGHLCIEKLFKALLIKKTQSDKIPYIHNLVKLAKYCEIKTTHEIDKKLATINTFNIDAKYQIEDLEFFFRCTKEYTEEQINIIKEVREWLKEKLTQ